MTTFSRTRIDGPDPYQPRIPGFALEASGALRSGSMSPNMLGTPRVSEHSNPAGDDRASGLFAMEVKAVASSRRQVAQAPPWAKLIARQWRDCKLLWPLNPNASSAAAGSCWNSP